MSFLYGGAEAVKAAAEATTKAVTPAATAATAAAHSGAEAAFDAVGDGIAGGLNSFGQLLKDFNVIGFVLGMLIANGVAAIATSFIEGILMPTIQPLINKLGTKDGQASVSVGGLTFHLGKFINALLKFLALAVVIFVLMQFGVQMTRPITWVRVQQVKPGLKLA